MAASTVLLAAHAVHDSVWHRPGPTAGPPPSAHLQRAWCNLPMAGVGAPNNDDAVLPALLQQDEGRAAGAGHSSQLVQLDPILLQGGCQGGCIAV
jgi:hypothetical protein